MKPPIRYCIEAVAEAYRVPVAVLLSDYRHRPIAHARQAAMMLARSYGYSYPRIGKAFGRDHSTVITGVRAAQGRRNDRDAVARFLVERRIERLWEAA